MELKKVNLTIDILINEAKEFCEAQSKFKHPELYGITDGKAVGTFIEQGFQKHLKEKYEMVVGNSATGIDLPSPDINTDIKVTSIKQPQSSCPFKDARQKIFGLGYNLLVFVYDKMDEEGSKTSTLNFVSCTFISEKRTADFSTTFRLREMIKDNANIEDILAYLNDRNIPAYDVALKNIAEDILATPPQQGYLTISNALQWRLQYMRIVNLEDHVEGVTKIIQYKKPAME